jgi:hypothetical protein
MGARLKKIPWTCCTLALVTNYNAVSIVLVLSTPRLRLGRGVGPPKRGTAALCRTRDSWESPWLSRNEEIQGKRSLGSVDKAFQ